MELIDSFLKTEEKYRLNTDKIEEYEYWNYNRFYIYCCFVDKKNNFLTAHEKIKLQKQIFRYLSNILPCLVLEIKRYIYLSRNSKPQLLVKCHPRRSLIDGKMACVYSDLLTTGLDNVIHYETTQFYKHLTPCMSSNMLYLDYPEIMGRVNYCIDRLFFTNKYRYLYNKIKSKLEKILIELEKENEVSVNKDSIVITVVKHYYLVKAFKKYWAKELKEKNISNIIEVVGYSIDSMTLNSVAHSLGYHTTELQHGYINESHAAYQYLSTESIDTLPNTILSFGDYWSKQINMPGVNVKPIGYEYFYLLRDQYFNKYKKKEQILILSQRNIGQRLAEIAVKLSNLCLQSPNIKIIYKLHPSEFEGYRNLYPDLLYLDNVEIVTNEVHLYQLFSESKIQIGYNSTALFEGMGFGLDTYFINDDDSMIHHMIEDGIAKLIDNNMDLIELINNLINKNSTDRGDSLISKLWAKNARENFIKYLNTTQRSHI